MVSRSIYTKRMGLGPYCVAVLEMVPQCLMVLQPPPFFDGVKARLLHKGSYPAGGPQLRSFVLLYPVPIELFTTH